MIRGGLFLGSHQQQDLFGGGECRPKAYVPDPRHVRNRLADMLASMQAAEAWPWEPVMVALYRETVWPYLYGKLPDRDEAERWRAEIDAEIARLDRASARNHDTPPRSSPPLDGDG